MLKIRELHAGYGATPILFGVSLEVREGEAVALLGKNGMGKTTLMKAAMGFIKPTRGAIHFEGSDLTRLTPHEIARRGVGFVPENRRIFPGLTVRENLELGLSALAHRPAALRRRRSRSPTSSPASPCTTTCAWPLSRARRSRGGSRRCGGPPTWECQ